jgi:dephospho-CoA kinase
MPDARSTVERFDHADDPGLWRKRLHASADPGRPTDVALRVDGWPNQQYALLLVAWGAAHPDVRDDDYRAAWAWADRAGWRP